MFAPKKIKDLVGNPTAHKQLEELIKDGTPCRLIGPPGVGKTSGVHVIGRELGYKIIEVNASDDRRAGTEEIPGELRHVLYRVQMNSPFDEKFLVFLDEVDGMGSKNMDGPSAWRIVEDIITKSKHPVILAANDDYKIPETIKKLTIKIDFRHTDQRTVAKLVQKYATEMKLTPDMTNISGDIRSGLSALFGGEGYAQSGDFLNIQRFFIQGGEINKEDYPWLMDNFPEFYKGYDLYESYVILSVASRISPEALKLLIKGKSGRVKHPTYYQVRKKEKNNDGTE
jgi:DNA polymerase III delta prime subunit